MDIRAWRAVRNRRYNRLWWSVFFVGGGLAAGLAAFSERFNIGPWLILGGLLGMILGRRRHHREQAARDARQDEQSRQAAKAAAARTADLEKAATNLAEANHALAELVAEVKNAQARQVGSGGDDPPKP